MSPTQHLIADARDLVRNLRGVKPYTYPGLDAAGFVRGLAKILDSQSASQFLTAQQCILAGKLSGRIGFKP